MRALDVIFRPQSMRMGRLYLHQGRLSFEFTDAFIALGLNISPFHLKLRQGIQTSDVSFRGYLHGVFDDSLPDGWGLLLMDRVFRAKGVSKPFSPLDRLAYIGDHAMGALAYYPAMDPYSDDRTLFDIQKIANHSVDLFEGVVDDVLPVLARAGGSSGGARPKVLVGINHHHMISGAADLPTGYDHWIVKFSAKKDLATAGVMEYVHYKMALASGLTMMESRLFPVGEHLFFGTKRFDRIGNDRVHTHTVGNLVNANFKAPSMEYESLIKLTRILTRNAADVTAMFRLMVFNVMINNQDDHVKNFSFIMDAHGAWRLSPAYDLTEAVTDANEHATSINGKGANITRDDMLTVSDQAGISRADALLIIARVEDVVADKQKYTRHASLHVMQQKDRG